VPLNDNNELNLENKSLAELKLSKLSRFFRSAALVRLFGGSK
jgi:hypothetical protein